MIKTTEPKPALILSIDAWAERESGWTWNDHYKVGTIDLEILKTLNTNRKLLAYMRTEGYLSSSSQGKVRISDNPYDGVFIEFQDRSSGEPLFAISTIHG